MLFKCDKPMMGHRPVVDGADCETAVALFGRSNATMGLARISSIGHLNKILKRHGQVVVKNYGSMFDSSCQYLTFSVDSEKLISSSDEDLLRSLIVGGESKGKLNYKERERGFE
ncbi:CST complex subunit CTC1 [Forsythia ovata]|uniref:CST complex subunit CTC1 n=1 Tax=Forsythia ovata TaxID=205694 RepID=A0ABD1W8D1_9LAMI